MIPMSALVERDHKVSYSNLVGHTTMVVSAGSLLLHIFSYAELTTRW